MKIRKICVYCGSSPGKNPAFSLAASSLAKAMMADLADGFVALPGGWGRWRKFLKS